MCFDECTPFPATHDQASDSMRLSMKWAERCKYAFNGSQNQLFGIVQGSTYSDLREESVNMVISITNSGYIKRVPLEMYRAQKRGGKGRSGMKTNDEDFVTQVFTSSTHDNMLFFSSSGIVYKLKTWKHHHI